MKKISVVVSLAMFGIAFQAQAVSINSNQGAKAGQTVPQVQGNQGTGNTVPANEPKRVMNQGESGQIKTQEQNAVQAQQSTPDETGGREIPSNPSTQNRSQVANAVHAMLQIAERNEGVGQRIRAIAQNQTQNQMKLDQSVGEIQKRGGLIKFFAGPDYGEIKASQQTLEQNREQIRQLDQIRTQLENAGDQQQLSEQINILEQANQKIEILLTDAQNGFSLFGWLNRLVS